MLHACSLNPQHETLNLTPVLWCASCLVFSGCCLAVAWPLPGRCLAVAWPLPGRCLARSPTASGFLAADATLDAVDDSLSRELRARGSCELEARSRG